MNTEGFFSSVKSVLGEDFRTARLQPQGDGDRDVDSVASKEDVLDAFRNVAAEGDCIECKGPGYAGSGGSVFFATGA